MATKHNTFPSPRFPSPEDLGRLLEQVLGGRYQLPVLHIPLGGCVRAVTASYLGLPNGRKVVQFSFDMGGCGGNGEHDGQDRRPGG